MSVNDTGAGRRPGRRGRRDPSRPLLPGDGPLARIPPVAAFAVVVVVFAAAVIVGGVVGAALLGVLALGVVVLLAATWPHLTATDRIGRVLVLAVLVAVAVGLVVRGGLA